MKSTADKYTMDMLDALLPTRQERKSKATLPTKATPKGRVVQLSVAGLAPDKCATPHAFSKSPLFGGVSKNSRKRLMPGEDLVLPATYGYQIVLTGGLPSRIPGPYGTEGEIVSGVMSQADLTIFLGLLILSGHKLGALIELEPYRFLKAIKRDSSKGNAVSLFKSIARMRETRIAVRYMDGERGLVDIVANLINGVSYEHSTGRYSLSLDPMLARLFAAFNYTTIDFQQRLELRTSLAQYLHAMVLADKSGSFVYHLDNVKDGYGSQGSQRQFRSDCKAAMAEIATLTGWHFTWQTPEKFVANRSGRTRLAA